MEEELALVEEAVMKRLAPAVVPRDGKEEEGLGRRRAAVGKYIDANRSQTKCLLGWRI